MHGFQSGGRKKAMELSYWVLSTGSLSQQSSTRPGPNPLVMRKQELEMYINEPRMREPYFRANFSKFWKVAYVINYEEMQKKNANNRAQT